MTHIDDVGSGAARPRESETETTDAERECGGAAAE